MVVLEECMRGGPAEGLPGPVVDLLGDFEEALRAVVAQSVCLGK